MSFESGLSDDYAIPPDAVSAVDTTCMDASMPSLLMRTSYADSPKKMETLEKVRVLPLLTDLGIDDFFGFFRLVTLRSWAAS